MSKIVEIPNVTVSLNLHDDGKEPMVLIATGGDGKGHATIYVEGWKVDKDSLCALLRVVATTIENDPDRALHA